MNQLASFSFRNSFEMSRKNFKEFFFIISDPIRIYHINYWIYVFTGFWEYNSLTEWKTQLYKIYRFVIALIYVFLVYSYFNEAILLRYDLDQLSLNMSNNILVVITVLKITFVKMQTSRVQSLLDDLTNNLNETTIDQSIDDRKILEKRARIILNLSRVLYGLLVVSFSLRIVADTAFDTKSYLIPFPFKDSLGEYYSFIYVHQVFVAFHILVTVIAHDLFVYGIINRLIAHFEILEKNFRTINRLYSMKKSTRNGFSPLKNSLIRVFDKKPEWETDERENEQSIEKMAREMLKKNIAHHQKLLKETMNFSEIYSPPFVVQAIGAVFITGIVAIKILLMSNQVTPLLMQQIMYVGINLFNNFCLCTFGSELTNKSIDAANALYDVPWYEMGSENRKIVNFAMKNLLQGPKLKGGGLVVINKVTYLKFLHTSYNMVVLLRNVYKS